MNGGAYPWRIDGDFTTVASVTNVGATTSRFVAQIYYPGGTYLLAPRELVVGETAFFDLKQIRDLQVPDANGAVLPRSVSMGQFRWHWYPSPNAPHMIGRAAMLSASQGISASYSCMPNCGAHGPEYLIDGNTTVFTGAYETMHTREQWCGAGGGCDAWNTNLSGSTVDNTSIASLSNVSTGWLNTNGLDAGATYWWWTYWYGFEYDDGFDCRYEQDEVTASEPADVIVPAFLTVASISTLATGTSGDYGCSPDADFGIRVAVRYHVYDQNGSRIRRGDMEPQETLTDYVLNQIAQTGSSNFTDIGPTHVSGTSQFTDANGTFLDAPVGGCYPINNTYSIRQQIFILVNGRRWIVRINDFSGSSTSAGSGSMTNGSDIQKSR